MKYNFYKQASFEKNCDNLQQLPTDEGFEVVMVGRSNAGKSSMINAITGQKKLAKISKSPGCTRQFVCFNLDAQRRIIDIPGYGYAKVKKDLRQKWFVIINNYFESRGSLSGIFMIMDIRHPLQTLDNNFLDWATNANVPVHIILNKCDKISKNEAIKTLNVVKKQINYDNLSIQSFSATKGLGLIEARAKLSDFLQVNKL